ncbi:MAG: hypothetical protein ACJ8HQ_05790 [Chthoniobacterales bacterium]
MRLLTLGILILVGLGIRSCGRKPTTESERARSQHLAEASASPADADADEEREEEAEKAPDSGDIGEDCIAFLRATKIAPPPPANNGNCPQCPETSAAEEVFQFNDMKIDRIAPSAADNAEVDVRIFATFRPGHGGVIGGGLTGWIPPEQRSQYEHGDIPAGQQVYRVRITYRRNAAGWQPLEFSPIAP